MNGVLKEIFGLIFEAMLKEGMKKSIGDERNSKDPKITKNRKNGTTPKTVKTTMGEILNCIPRERDDSFEPHVNLKWAKVVSAIFIHGSLHVCKGVS